MHTTSTWHSLELCLQEAQRAYVEKGMPEELLCAYVNNNMRCYDESTEFAESMEDSLDEAHKVAPDSDSCLECLLTAWLGYLRMVGRKADF